MSASNIVSNDPRERLLSVGNRLLDVIYKLDETSGLVKQMEAFKDDEGASKAFFDDGGMEKVISRLTLSGERDSLLREYVTLRSTIEALTGDGANRS